MSTIEFETYVDIPIRVIAHRQQYVRATRHHPGQQPTIGIDKIEILSRNLESYIMATYGDSLKEEAEGME